MKNKLRNKVIGFGITTLVCFFSSVFGALAAGTSTFSQVYASGASIINVLTSVQGTVLADLNQILRRSALSMEAKLHLRQKLKFHHPMRRPCSVKNPSHSSASVP